MQALTDGGATDGIVADTCAAVWSRLALARGGAAFGGFVRGRFLSVLRAACHRHGSPTPPSRSDGPAASARVADAARLTSLAACLDDLRARNPWHQRAIELVYVAQATVGEAGDLLGADEAEVRAALFRARLALARCITENQAGAAPLRPSRRRPGRPGGPPRAGARQPPRRRPGGRSGGRR